MRQVEQALEMTRLGVVGGAWPVGVEEAIVTEGLEGLFVARAGGDRPVPAAWYRAHASTATTTTVALQELAEALRILEQQGHDLVLLPGAALLRFYPDAGCRPMDDVDLLCPEGRTADVTDALTELGWTTTPRYPDLLNGRHVGIDLHDDLFHCQRIAARRRAGWLDPEQIWAHRRRVQVEGLQFWGLSAEDEVLYTAAHALRHSYRRVTWLVDLALQLGDRTLDGGRLRYRAEASGLNLPLLYGLTLLHAARVDLPASVRDWYAECAPGRTSRRVLQWVLGSRHSTCVGEVLWNWTCPHRGDRLRLMREFMFPRTDVLLQVFPRVPRRLAPLTYGLRCGQLLLRLAQELATTIPGPLSRRMRRG